MGAIDTEPPRSAELAAELPRMVGYLEVVLSAAQLRAVRLLGIDLVHPPA